MRQDHVKATISSPVGPAEIQTAASTSTKNLRYPQRASLRTNRLSSLVPFVVRGSGAGFFRVLRFAVFRDILNSFAVNWAQPCRCNVAG